MASDEFEPDSTKNYGSVPYVEAKTALIGAGNMKKIGMTTKNASDAIGFCEGLAAIGRKSLDELLVLRTRDGTKQIFSESFLQILDHIP